MIKSAARDFNFKKLQTHLASELRKAIMMEKDQV